MVRFFARPYIGGYGMDDALEKADKLWESEGIKTTLDLLGEFVNDKETVEFNLTTYLDAIDRLKGREEYVSVSIKLTAFGILFDEELAFSCIEKIVKKGYENSVLVTLDMEDHPYTDITLNLYKELLVKYPGFGTVLQSRLFRTKEDIVALHELEQKCRIRICIGIYNEPEEIAYQKKPPMKDKLLEFGEDLIKHGHFTEYATHDRDYVEKFLNLVEEKGYDKKLVEIQHLKGVPLLNEQRDYIKRGYPVRLYLPFVINKKDATAYLKRRMLNNPNMAIYVLRNLFRLN